MCRSDNIHCTRIDFVGPNANDPSGIGYEMFNASEQNTLNEAIVDDSQTPARYNAHVTS